MTYKFCFFDADDTLFDFSKAAEVSFTKSLEFFGIILDDSRIYKTFAANSKRLWQMYENGEVSKDVVRRDRFRLTFLEHQIPLDPDKMSSIYLDNLCENVYLMPGAVEVCREIKKRNLTLGVISNGIGQVQFARLARTPLKELVDFTVVSEEKLMPKPHRHMFDAALLHANNPPLRECIMVGDNLTSDILGANRVGIDSCWYNPRQDKNTHNIRPKFEVRHLNEILNL